ncbi:hypothetical protein, variant [Saprolegnia diclina VS20]|uniref:histone acetyltransferase n=1 Tax=Saprolegnia diclina (strain VS20) TaxID=1156394 RepID=T0QZQ3_SAPDV|nr:hypothetical protein, variant [Saprolegnia diclina VS20]EQC40191.1 hypothetical protein, variant [Saprolegnia diclina VS20]|eukprot:XP_008606665.1 hypothetical protein, variant [Saprolegnia diclina VS20]
MDKAFATDFGDASNFFYGNQFNPPGNGDASGGDDAAIEFPDELNNTTPNTNNNAMNPAQMNNAMLMQQQQQQYAAQFNPMLAAGYSSQFQMNPQLFMSQMTPQQRQYLQQQQYMMMQHQQRLLMAHQQQAAQSAAMLQAANANANANAAASVPPTPTPAPTSAPPTPAAPATTWQSPNDNPSRREVITRIIHFLQSQKPNAPPDWMRRLPQMAKKLEESLYRNAASKAEYMDPNTLKQRLQVVARSFHTMKQATATPATPQQPTSTPSRPATPTPVPTQGNLMQTFRARVGQIAALVAAPTAAQYNQRVQHMMGQLEQFRPMLVKQHHRLLLLRHATWCHSAECKVTDCAEMKTLWTHMPTCGQMSQCGVQHCISSKYLLSHFQQCSLGPCLVCQIVRVPLEAKDAAGQLIADPAVALTHLRQLQQAQQQAKLNATPRAADNNKPETLKRSASQMSIDTSSTSMQSLLQTPTQPPKPSPTQPAAVQQSGMMQPQPGMMPQQAGMVPQQPGMVPQQPGMMTQHPGMMQPQPNMMQPQPGMMPHQPGMMPQQPGMMPQQPGMMPQQPGMMPQHPGMMPQQPGMMQPNMVAMQQQQLMLQQKQQIEVLKKRFSEWTPEQLHAHSKKLEALAESLRSHMQKSAVDANKQMELFQGSMDPAARQRYQHAAMDAQRQLQDFKAKYQRCLTQYKIISFTIQSRSASISTPPTPPAPASTPPSATTTVATPPETTTMSPENAKPEPAAKKMKPELKPEVAMPADEPPGEAASPSTYMLPQMTDMEIRAHVASLQSQHCASLTVAQLKKKLEPLLRSMMDHKFGWVFSSPVDPIALNIPNYFDIIRRPMDFGTIKKKLDANLYKHLAPFAADVRLTFRNAMTYNNEESDVHQLAKDMLGDFNAELSKVEKEVAADEASARARDGACKLCGMESMVFEPAILYCNGECNTRIRRNCYYYCAPDNKYHCCTNCFPALPESISAPSNDGGPYEKSGLVRKKNDEVHEEPWVQCDHCNQWVHQVCALFHHKPGSESNEKTTTMSTAFHCPECLLSLRAKSPSAFPLEKKLLSAKHLPRSKLSDFLERRVQHLLAKEAEADPSTGKADALVIRQVSNIEKQLIVRDKMYARYKEHKIPSEHRFKSKCLCMFQETHGVSVLLFGMYVHEFDEQESAANQRRVYVSYLDSVNYLEPVHLRTKVYHEILIGYLEFVKQRGFHTAHIWACPPLKGDDYILYCHPESQKTPKSDRLRQWYVQMLLKAKEEGIVVDIHNMYDEYWSHAGASPMALPYFEGDYWVGLAEDLIEKMDEEEKADVKTKKPAKASINKLSKPNKRQGKDKDKSEAEVIDFSDPLMAKLGEVIKPMKEDFLVVNLFPCCKNCKSVVGAGTVWKETKPAPKTSAAFVCDSCYQASPLPEAAWVPTPLPLVLRDKCVDPDELVESEVFDTRQAFLSLCQANHYQFDDLRRAKHTSMMTLYHVGQPPNGYVYSCNVCSADITSGTRWHCNTCPDYDVCESCHTKKAQVHVHILEAIGTLNETMRKAREERAKSIALHMQLLVHASSCNAEKGNCTSLNCEKMKELLRHGGNCKLRATGGCTICRRVWALLQIHARQCRNAECSVPRCKDLREHLRKLALQQQLMDDRRRAAVTEQYRQLNTTEAPVEGASA